MTTFQDIADSLEALAPPCVAESYDNVGLLVGVPTTNCTGILVNLDVTEEMLDEAKNKNANLIVTHHPIWFSGRKRLNGEDYVSRILIKAIQYGIGLYACHTNLDNIRNGVNARMAQALKLENLHFLQNKSHPTGIEIGSGMIGELPQALSPTEFLQKVKTAFHCGGIRYATAPLAAIRKVAICGGSGSFLIAQAIRAGADALVTADITYHKFFDNENQIFLLDIGHYESEQFTSELVLQYISEKFPNFAVHLSEIKTNPVKYF